ncbi:hypothetical protein [Microviridae sp.]|jgi:hypothetical protein|nr:hypothetical protein [Microviridae sp.]
MKKLKDSTKSTSSKKAPATTQQIINNWNTDRIRKQFQQPFEMKGQTNNSPSLTVPDQTLGIKELLNNHTRGISSNVKMYEGEYFDTEIPIINDLTDLDDYRADLKARQIALENHIKAEDDAKRQKRQEQLDRENNVIETPKYIPPKTDKEN